MGDTNASGRPYRSKSQRPCDRCRRRKTVCIIESEGPCQSCSKASQSCAFDMPPSKRRRSTGYYESTPSIRQRSSMDHASPPIIVRPSLGTDEPSRSAGITIPASSSRSNHLSPTYGTHLSDSRRRTLVDQVGGQASVGNVSPAAGVSGRSHYEPGLHSPRQPDFHTTSPLNQLVMPQAVQYVCSLDQINGATAQLCGISAELDPWLLRHCKYDEFGMRNLQNIRVRNVGGVPVAGLVPVHFTVADDYLLTPRDTKVPTGNTIDTETGRQELENIIPIHHGVRLISLFLKFAFPVMPILSLQQLSKQLTEQNIPVVLLAAIYATALPYIVHDQVLFISGVYNESLIQELWRMVYQQIHEGYHNPKLGILQASLLYLQRLPTGHQRALSDTPSRSSFLGSTIALAMSLGLHLEPRPWGIPGWEKRLRRRLWWAVYMEDKWNSLLLGRPPIIRRDEWDIFDLEESDFESVENITLGTPLPVEWPQDDTIFTYFIRLSQLVDLTHEALYTLKASKRLSEDFRASIDAARPIRQALQAWYSGLPEDFRLKGRLEGHFHRGRHPGVAALHFSYLVLELFLYRAILRPLARSPPPPPVSQEEPFDPLSSEQLVPQSYPTPWLLDNLTFENIELDQLPAVDFAEFGEAAEVTLNAAEKCAGIIVNFIATLTAQDFDILWYPWTRICFATVTNFITLLLVQAPTLQHATRSKELLDRWSLHLRCQHKSHEALMTLGLVRLHDIRIDDLGSVFTLSASATAVIEEGGIR